MIEKTIDEQIQTLKDSIMSILPSEGMDKDGLIAIMQTCKLPYIVMQAALSSLEDSGAIRIEKDMVVPNYVAVS